ncbi:MAG: ThuA domain-containing protein [Planctomycetota bacterium]|nr:ThuA domain-containing protein [Planctomycetota bacterium]
MARMYRGLFLVALAVLVAAWAAPAPAADAAKINLLIIDGQNGHKWAETTPVIKEMLEKTGRFTVEVLTSPPALAKTADDAAKQANKDAWAKFKPDFSKYQVVLSNYCGQPWPEDVQKSFEKFVNDGGGFVAYHFCIAAFKEWDAYNQMIGIGWKPADFGEGLALDDSGKEIHRAKGEGAGGSHGAAHPFEIIVRDKESPIMKGLPEKWMHISDELYGSLRGPAKNVHILCTAFSIKDADKQKPGTGMHEPIAWTVPFGKGRVFVTVLGHAVPETTAPDSVTILVRGCEWAATGQVTIPVQGEVK